MQRELLPGEEQPDLQERLLTVAQVDSHYDNGYILESGVGMSYLLTENRVLHAVVVSLHSNLKKNMFS